MQLNDITVVIAEDEKFNRDFLKQILNQYPDINVIGEASNGRELLEICYNHSPQVIFADIEMPEMDGLTAVQTLTTDSGNQPMIVFITGHAEYAVDAFELSGFDYILKPYKPDRVKKTIERVRNRIREKNLELRKLLNTVQTNNKICIKVGTGLRFIDIEKIIYIEKVQKRTVIHTEDSKFETGETLNSLEQRLDPIRFFRSHKCFIVNLKKIEQIVPWGKHSHLIRFANSKMEVLISYNKLLDLQRLMESP